MRTLLALSLTLTLSAPVWAQALPRVAALYPAGAKVGSTQDVAIRGGVEGAREIIVSGPGITAKLNDSGIKVDPEEQKLFAGKCTACHELRGPGTLSRNADQWAQTVDRMIRDRGAPIDTAERGRIVNYLQTSARAQAGLSAKITVAADATPGRREIRIVGANGTSTAFPFEVTRQDESLEQEPNDDLAKASEITFPCLINGQLQRGGDVDYYGFRAKKGERLTFNVSAFRLNRASQAYFFPVLYLYDDKGKELARNTGYFSLDPLIDWTASDDGRYVLQVRDMLYRGSPATIYRLTAGSLPYAAYAFPAGAKRGSTASIGLFGENMSPSTLDLALPASAPIGVRQIETEMGPVKIVVDDNPDVSEAEDVAGTTPPPLKLPAGINGRLAKADEVDRYTFTLAQEQLGLFAFELYAERVGSPVLGRLTLRNGKGEAMATNNGGQGVRDPRIDYTFNQPGGYVIEIADQNGKGSPAHVYRLAAAPAAPDLQVTLSPDNPNLGPGSSVFLQARVIRRIGVSGPITVSLKNLPPGVTASECVLQPGQNDGYVVLSAASGAEVGRYAVLDAVATAGSVSTPVQPLDIYRINNNAQIAPRENLVVTIGPEAPWSVEIDPPSIQLSATGPPVDLTVRIKRRGGDSQQPFAIVGLPNGVQGPRNILFRRGTDTFTFQLRGSNQGVFQPAAANQPKPPTRYWLTLVNGREADGMQMARKPIPVDIRLDP